MKKILIAAAVVSAFAGSAQAQSSVTLFGIVDLGVRFDRTSGAGTLKQLESGDFSGSRWGMRGTEDLGRGLKANFLVESAISADNGASTGFTRSSWVGLSGGFGEFRMGLDYSPYFNAWSKTDIFGATSLAGVGFTGVVPTATSAAPGSGSANQWVGGATRMNNGLYYKTPRMGGLSGEIAFDMGEGNSAATKKDGDTWSAAVIYANGPITAQLGHFRNRATAALTAKDTTLGGAYDFKVAKVSLTMWQRRTSTNAINDRTWSVGVSAPVGAWTFLAHFARIDDKTVGNADASKIGLGARYALSKRTDFYAHYGRINNNANAQYAITGGLQSSTNVGLDSSPQAWSAGVRHRF